MNDLFECDIGMPVKSLLSPLHGFQDFWNSQPPGYKIARPQCEKKWKQLKCCDVAMHILMHMEYLKTTDKYQRGIIPNPLTYLNQQRWLDWEPETKPKKPDWLQEYAEHEKRAVPMPANLRRK
jgi:hypothetical protein